MNKQDEKTSRQYYVDEAGDGILFNAKGKVIIGEEGCSRYFMLGLLDVPNSEALSQGLEELRANPIRDPYFRQIPSMQIGEGKTAVAFHAKDDIAEVRREVFAILLKQTDLRFFAVVRDKRSVLLEVQQYKNKRYHPNLLYDQLVGRLFKDRLHKEDEYTINFAKRGRSDRTRALEDALKVARRRFEKQWSIKSKAVVNIVALQSAQDACLQAADYFLWALQRCYERREDRYLDYIWKACHLVYDVDDIRKAKYGTFYTQKEPITIDILSPL